MVQEEKGMEPLFRGRTAFFVHELIFSHENAGKDRQADVSFEGPGGIGDEEDKRKARQDGQCVEGMANALPFGQTAADMEVKLVEHDDEGLDGEGQQKKNQHF